MKEDTSIPQDSDQVRQPLQHGSNNLLEDFAYITSHNLRGPVSNLETLLYLWEHQDAQDIREDLFEKAKTVIQHLSDTLEHLVSELQIRNSKDIPYEMVDLSVIAEYAMKQNSARIDTDQACVTFDFTSDVNLYTSKLYIEKIFSELLKNSLTFRHSQHKPVVRFKIMRDNGRVKILCSDNGSGIDLKRNGLNLFKFQRTFHHAAMGKGVGLYIMKAQVEALGGTIEVSSEVNSGSTFIISLPEHLE